MQSSRLAPYLHSGPGLGSVLLTLPLCLSLLTPRDTWAQTTVNKQGSRLISSWIPVLIRIVARQPASQASKLETAPVQNHPGLRLQGRSPLPGREHLVPDLNLAFQSQSSPSTSLVLQSWWDRRHPSLSSTKQLPVEPVSCSLSTDRIFPVW